MSRVHLGHSIRRGIAAMTATAWWALGALVLAALVVFLCTIPLVRAVFISATAKEAEATDLKKQYALHDQSMDGYVKQIDGRSLFVIPPPFPQKRVESAPIKRDPTPVVVDKGPTSYGGPTISAIINDTVWFGDGKKLKLGDPAKDDVAVTALDAPWSATLAWKGKDFEVPFFERDRLIHPRPGTLPLPASASNLTEPVKKPETTKPDAPKSDEKKSETPVPSTVTAETPKAVDSKASETKTEGKTEGDKKPQPPSEPK